jgi:pimeloyl-ACP methyl ester carboxylesterase
VGEQAMNTPNPVVIIPGYYGTLLLDQAANDRTVWLTLDGLFHSGEVLDAINLETGDPDRIVSGGILEEIHIIGRWAPNFYKGLRMFFGSLGFPPEQVISFGVDWRRTLDFNIDQLHDKISRIGNVNIVAHSHGGLVARAYLHKHGGTLVDSLITLGTPHKGMLDTFQALAEGIDFFKWSKSHLMKTARTFPSAYELLPSDPGDGLFQWNSNKNADPFANNGWADASMQAKLLDAAGVVSSLPRTLPVKSAFIFGTHRDTVSLASGGTNKKLKFITKPAGDGTVPTISASGNGLSGDAVERYAIPYGIHSQLFEDPAAQTVMKNILFNRPMAHFAFGFSREMFFAGQTIGLGVDLRGPHGEVFADADVRININGQDIPLQRDDDAGDYFVSFTTPSSPQQHLQYKITASSSALSQPFTKVGALHSINS